MNIHEYQAKLILQNYHIDIPHFDVISSIEEAKSLGKSLDWPVVIKVQIHAGGRGKGGGVKIANNFDEFLNACQGLLGKKIITPQTGSNGIVCSKLLISKALDIEKEGYLGVFISRSLSQAVVIASPLGGIDIEAVAKNEPEKVLILSIPEKGELHPFQLRDLAQFMGWGKKYGEAGSHLVRQLVKIFKEKDLQLIEINPLVQTKEERLYALDAKMVVDDNALWRQKELEEFFDPTQVPSQEATAKEFELAYIGLDGDIGCMVNGAGLAMATMDIIRYYGGNPANFLDVGGSATPAKVAEGFKIILSDKKVKVVLVNIFGGIMSCKTVAQGIIDAAEELKIEVPIVVRIEGTEVEKGKALLEEYANLLKIYPATSLEDAAKLAVNFEELSERN